MTALRRFAGVAAVGSPLVLAVLLWPHAISAVLLGLMIAAAGFIAGRAYTDSDPELADTRRDLADARDRARRLSRRVLRQNAEILHLSHRLSEYTAPREQA